MNRAIRGVTTPPRAARGPFSLRANRNPHSMRKGPAGELHSTGRVPSPAHRRRDRG